MGNHSRSSAKNAPSETPRRTPHDTEALVPLPETVAKMEPILRSSFESLLQRAALSRVVRPSPKRRGK
jgi:hypothetical protein